MSDHLAADSLSTTRHVVLILRLVLAPGKRQVKGDVLDPETGWTNSFVGSSGLTRVIERWVVEAEQAPGDEGNPDRPE